MNPQTVPFAFTLDRLTKIVNLQWSSRGKRVWQSKDRIALSVLGSNRLLGAIHILTD